MAYADRRVARGKVYFRACYQRPDRKAQGYVVDQDGRAVRYPTKTTAQKAAEKAEVEAFEAARKGRWVPPEQAVVAAQVTFASFAEEVMTDLGLAASTEQNYARSLAHLLPRSATWQSGTSPLAWWRRGKRSSCDSSRSTV